MAIQITLPKDAEDKEVPLDTEMLYDEYGNQHNIVNLYIIITVEFVQEYGQSNMITVLKDSFRQCI